VTVRSILCAVDFSAQSRTALRYAVAMARRFNSRLAVLFVNDPLLLAAASAAYRDRRRFVRRTNAELARFVKEVTPGRRSERERFTSITAVGHPAEEILRQARRRRSDLIVMGSHGLRGVSKVFLGSTTEQVLRDATVPVLAVPPTLRPRSVSIVATTRVIAPIDLAGEWQSDAVRAADIAAELDAELLLVHVLATVQTPQWLRTADRGHERRRLDKARAALDRVRTKLFFGRRAVSTTVKSGDAAHEIARLASRRGSLVVMSLRGTAGIWGSKRGAVAYHVLTHSSMPVLALPRRRIGGRFLARAKKAIDEALTARDRVEIAGIDALLSVDQRRTRIRR
jgi:nucleotide-binding universal stress UspA family protein